jgi:hypothetical protein
VSTLSEIAANHAKAAKTLDAESTLLKALGTPPSQICDTPAADHRGQMPPHAIATIDKRLPGQRMYVRTEGGMQYCGQ